MGTKVKRGTTRKSKTVSGEKNRDWSKLVAIEAIENGKKVIYRVSKRRINEKIKALGDSYVGHGKFIEL